MSLVPSVGFMTNNPHRVLCATPHHGLWHTDRHQVIGVLCATEHGENMESCQKLKYKND